MGVIEVERGGGFWVAASRVARDFPCHVLGFNPTFLNFGGCQDQKTSFPTSYHTQDSELG